MAETKQEVKHTATPWRIHRNSADNGWLIYGPDPEPQYITLVQERNHPSSRYEQVKADAELIVRAVNNFEGMLVALEGALEFIDGIAADAHITPECYPEVQAANAAIRAAKQGR